MTKRKPFLLLALMAALVLALALTGCEEKPGKDSLSTDDASRCVQVELDATYKGQFDGFLDFYSNVTKNDARDQYNSNIEYEANYFLHLYGMTDPEDNTAVVEPTEMQLATAEKLYKDIYAKADYSVMSSNKQDDGSYAVRVVIKPMDIIHLVDDNFDDHFADFIAKFDAVDVSEFSQDELLDWYRNTYSREYYDVLLDLLEQQIPNIGYGDEKSVVVQVLQDEENALSINSDDMGNLDWAIIDYND